MNIIKSLDIKSYKDQITLAMLLCFFISEAATKLAFRFDLGFHNYSALIKGIFAVGILSYSIFVWDAFIKTTFLFLATVTTIFLVGHLAFNDYSLGDNFFKNIIFFCRYILVFVLALFLLRDNFQISHSVLKVYEKIVVFNSVLIIAGALFEISLFQTYHTRFGYNGLFMTPSIGTYFYALALTYFTYKYLFYKQKIPELILVAVVCLLLGTKALLLFLLLTGLHIFMIKKSYRSKLFYIIMAGIIVLFFIFKEKVIGFLVQKFDVLFKVNEEEGLITMLTSLRDKNLRDDFIPLVTEQWNVLNFLFGGTDFEMYRVEFEIFDVFLFFGIIGTVLYLWNYFNRILIFKKINMYGKYQIGLLLLIALLSGNFFNNAPVALYLLLVLSFLYMENYNNSDGKV